MARRLASALLMNPQIETPARKHRSMALNLIQIDTDARVFPSSDVRMNQHGNGRPHPSIWRRGPFARWNKPRWGVFLLLVLVGNILVATIAWMIVRLVVG
jgi:hypothetical protein